MDVGAERKMIVQFGIDWNTDDDELVVIPREEHSINGPMVLRTFGPVDTFEKTASRGI